MKDNDNAAHRDRFAFGDKGASEEIGLPKNEIRKMRVSGLLEGAYAKIGHRSVIYDIDRLRRRVNEAFRAQTLA